MRLETLERARRICVEAENAVVMTGAGISAESGVPTFRGDDGLWKNHNPQDLATPEAFRRDPDLVWEWYGMRRSKIAEVSPNPGHRALAVWQSAAAVQLITQNVDDLHERAGSESVLHLHGSLWSVICSKCREGGEDKSLPHPKNLTCSHCGDLMRPGVVWFGESLDPQVLTTAFEWSGRCDVFLVIGTSGVVQPAASLAGIAAEQGARVVEVNPEETPLTSIAHVSLRGAAGEILPAILPQVGPERRP